MAAVAPAQFETCGGNLNYDEIGRDAEPLADGKSKVGLALDRSGRAENPSTTEAPGAEAHIVSGKENDGRGGEGLARAAKFSNGKSQRDDDAAAEEELSNAEMSSAEEKHDSDKSFSDADSVIAEEWEGGSQAADAVELEVANRNNCMLVSWILEIFLVFLGQKLIQRKDFVVKMKSMTLTKNMKSTWHVQYAEIIVSCEAFNYPI
jgi:hypothetical protein